MNVILCLDDKNGILFNRRRQSRDRLLCAHVLEHTAGQLWMNGYSAPLFADYADRIRVAEDFLNACPDTQWCFVENADLSDSMDRIKNLVVYRWNRVYPADRVFDLKPFGVPVSTEDFPGHSHDRITREVYTR